MSVEVVLLLVNTLIHSQKGVKQDNKDCPRIDLSKTSDSYPASSSLSLLLIAYELDGHRVSANRWSRLEKWSNLDTKDKKLLLEMVAL